MVVLKNDLIYAFDRVVTLRTVHAASKDLGLTQAAVTKRIRLLEDELGVSLFLRSRRGMILTEEGKALLQFSRRVNEAEGELIAKIAGTNRQEVPITIVGPTSFVSTRLPRNCAPLYEKYPFLCLNLRSDDDSSLVEMVRRGEADLAVVSPEKVPNEMESKMLRPDRYVLVASPDWKSRTLERILKEERIIDFYESDSTTLRYLQNFELEKHLGGRNRLFVNENEALIHYFISGVGFGTLTESIAHDYIEKGKLIRMNGGRALEDPLALAWYARSKEMAYFRDILAAIK